MRTVTFAREFDYPSRDQILVYPADFTGEVSEAVAHAAEKAGALKPTTAKPAEPKADKKPDARREA